MCGDLPSLLEFPSNFLNFELLASFDSLAQKLDSMVLNTGTAPSSPRSARARLGARRWAPNCRSEWLTYDISLKTSLLSSQVNLSRLLWLVLDWLDWLGRLVTLVVGLVLLLKDASGPQSAKNDARCNVRAGKLTWNEPPADSRARLGNAI